jgi:2-polyprenyl-3-methyl-5-hydroxy-6-metoxy-1,4-benzoquinol methylase
MQTTTDTASSRSHANDLCRAARALWAEHRPQSALETAWAAFDLDPCNGSAKRLLVALLWNFPSELSPQRQQAFLGLLSDREIDPEDLGPAGWDLVLRKHALVGGPGEADLGGLAEAVASDELALTLLREAPVPSPTAERLLTRLRRWLLLSDEWRRQPGLTSALSVQASLNGGAWSFDEAERACLDAADGAPTAAYLPRPPVATATEGEAVHPVTKAVTSQYEGWPYPAWTRITRPEPRRLPDVIQRMCAHAARHLPVDARILIAGCGTGRQAAQVASTYPDAAVTAVDVSQASLDYARRQCAALGIDGVEFSRLDLHDVAQLGRQFDVIYCGGVLHHLPDPERGLAALADVLRPHGVMKLAVYSQVARLLIVGARRFISDLTQKPVDDELLREVRRRFLDRPKQPLLAEITRGRDFATLAGTHDLLLHRHEDPFDVTRVERALGCTGLRLLSFELSSPWLAAQYDAMFPGDPKHRDFNSWRSFEMRHPRAFAGTYQFWCRKNEARESL